MRCYCAFDAPGCNGSRCMLTTLMTGRRPVCTADPTMGVQATTTAAAARTTVETTCRTRRAPEVVSMAATIPGFAVCVFDAGAHSGLPLAALDTRPQSAHSNRTVVWQQRELSRMCDRARARRGRTTSAATLGRPGVVALGAPDSAADVAGPGRRGSGDLGGDTAGGRAQEPRADGHLRRGVPAWGVGRRDRMGNRPGRGDF